jgi:S-adenosylmethionine-dependent methyltransferase
MMYEPSGAPRVNELANPDDERFQNGASKYATYLETPEGRLRLELAFANVQEFLPPATRPLHALDIGCGTGALGVRLAQIGIYATLLDSSSTMLDFAHHAVRDARVTDRVTLTQGDANQLGSLFDAASFDLILCHNVLEFVHDPCAVLRDAARLLRDSSGIISVLVRNQPGEVLKAALVNGDLGAAERAITAEWGDESLYGGKVRLFTAESLKDMLASVSLAVSAERGVRVLSDYLPPNISRDVDYDRIFQLERKLGGMPEFAAVARYTHCLAHRAGGAIDEGA